MRSLNANLFSVSLIICFDLKFRVRTFNWPDLDRWLTLGWGGKEASLDWIQKREVISILGKKIGWLFQRRECVLPSLKQGIYWATVLDAC